MKAVTRVLTLPSMSNGYTYIYQCQHMDADRHKSSAYMDINVNKSYGNM